MELRHSGQKNLIGKVRTRGDLALLKQEGPAFIASHHHRFTNLDGDLAHNVAGRFW
jgi:hypothetical protein